MSLKKSNFLLFAGDFVPSPSVLDMWRKERKLAESSFGALREIFRRAEHSFLNLECPLTDSEVVTEKSGPSLKGENNAIQMLLDLGVSCVNLANNHIFDFGLKGVEDTLANLNAASIDYTGLIYKGGKRNQIFSLNDKSVRVFNFCEHEFCGYDSLNMACLADPVDNFYEFKRAETTDYKVVVLHGGTEYCDVPSIWQRKICRYYVDLGADVVLCHHSHTICGSEEYKGKEIYYGLGNFLFDAASVKGSSWYEGYLLSIKESESGLKGEVLPFFQMKAGVMFQLMGRDSDLFLDRFESSSKILSDDNKFSLYWENRLDELSVNYMSCAWGLSRLERGVYRRLGVRVPRFGERSRLLRLLNYIKCQSHRVNMVRSLEKLVGK